ncbi:MAG: acid phosphatase [Acidobacteria bacterium]|nr:acid phosphatase [Acidobacteriota bacterium]
MSRLAPIFVSASLALSGVAPALAQAAAEAKPAAAAAATAIAPAVAPDDNLNAVLWTQRAIERELILQALYRNATEKLDAAIANPKWDALMPEEREVDAASLPPAIILDVDEAALDNSSYQARLVRSGEEYSEFSWSEWCKERKARAIPGAVDFVRAAVAKGVTVYYVSNRARDLKQATVDNLRTVGFPVPSEEVFLGLGVVVPGCEQFGSDKTCRRRLVGRKHRVLMQVGDQIGDFVEVVANTNDGRAEAMAPYRDWIGERWWPTPNPNYGSWEPAQFDNYWAQPRAARRKAKIEALRTD